jgi:hypothetical protein
VFYNLFCAILPDAISRYLGIECGLCFCGRLKLCIHEAAHGFGEVSKQLDNQVNATRFDVQILVQSEIVDFSSVVDRERIVG